MCSDHCGDILDNLKWGLLMRRCKYETKWYFEHRLSKPASCHRVQHQRVVFAALQDRSPRKKYFESNPGQ